MILGLGIDLLEVDRMARDLKRLSGLRERLFTPEEIAYCESKRYSAEHYAARFCAKEALLKAFGAGYRGGVSWLEIEVAHDAAGKPVLRLSGKVRELADRLRVNQCLVTITHTRRYALAAVVLET